jgi:hypothetical protein
MRRLIAFTILIGVSLLVFAGCATPFPIGSIYTDLTFPIVATSNGSPSPKVGTAECKSILCLVAIGDASIAAAKKNGGITKVHHVDWKAESVLGIVGKYKVVVYGD